MSAVIPTLGFRPDTSTKQPKSCESQSFESLIARSGESAFRYCVGHRGCPTSRTSHAALDDNWVNSIAVGIASDAQRLHAIRQRTGLEPESSRSSTGSGDLAFTQAQSVPDVAALEVAQLVRRDDGVGVQRRLRFRRRL